jgi:hypothetical protein
VTACDCCRYTTAELKPPPDTSWIKTGQIGIRRAWPWVLGLVLPLAANAALIVAVMTGLLDVR